jgi:hypothetical protein
VEREREGEGTEEKGQKCWSVLSLTHWRTLLPHKERERGRQKRRAGKGKKRMLGKEQKGKVSGRKRPFQINIV